MDTKKLAHQYLETKLKLTEQRRKIDYDCKRQFEELKKDTSVDGNLRVIHFRSQIQQEEQYYEELQLELTELEKDLKPTIEETKANRDNPLRVHVQEKTYFDVYINDKDELAVSDYYTQL